MLGKRWRGRYVPADPDKQFEHVIQWEAALRGTAIRCTKQVPEVGFEMETLYYSKPGSDTIVFESLSSRGLTSSGTVQREGDGFVLLGSDSRRRFKHSFELRPDGILEDRFLLDKQGEWVQGHLVEYHDR